MDEDGGRLLRGRIERVATFQPVIGGGRDPAALPVRNAALHGAALMQQLQNLAAAIKAREVVRDPQATRELVTVTPTLGQSLQETSLRVLAKDAVRIANVLPNGAFVLDTADASLAKLRRKITDFATQTKTTKHKDGRTTTKAKNATAIAPIETIGIATFADVASDALRTIPTSDTRAYWMELECRGGYLGTKAENDRSRAQVRSQLLKLGVNPFAGEFLAAEQLYLFAKLTASQAVALTFRTACVFALDLAPPDVRDTKLRESLRSIDAKDIRVRPPAQDAPVVVVLDTGIATKHPLLAPALLSAVTGGPELASVEDRAGHGTNMAGLALYANLGAVVEGGEFDAPHWIASAKVLENENSKTAAEENYPLWSALTHGAVTKSEAADQQERNRVFALAVTASMQTPGAAICESTLWSHCLEQLAYNGGVGRLMVVAAGNARAAQWPALAEQYPDLQLSEKIHQPGQAANVLTIGAFTNRIRIADQTAEHNFVAKEPGGISPFTSCGPAGSEWPIKPDICFEGGNLAFVGSLTETAATLTTSHRYATGSPLSEIAMTSEATAHAARMAANVWTAEPDLWPQTVRGLIAHSASWTPTLKRQFTGRNDLTSACGYGVPDLAMASACARDVATIVIEDEMPNAVRQGNKLPRKLKIFRLAMPTHFSDHDADVDLRVTLSYFAEPNKHLRKLSHGLDLKWDMQGPQESEELFIQRINSLARTTSDDNRRVRPDAAGSFNWDIGINLRSRGTLQSDRWSGKESALLGDKLIAVMPVLGWWDDRRDFRTKAMRFSLIVSVFGRGAYAAIKPLINVATEINV